MNEQTTVKIFCDDRSAVVKISKKLLARLSEPKWDEFAAALR